ncbi:MAG: T9SS type A sorting domain-containing protein, partial [Bacteroidetes bacterium]|nr:T9SS type A sorting domain-containing protein [Bacteroidota bacterium]
TYIYREDILPSNSDFTTGNYKGIAAINNSPSYNIGTQKRLTLTNVNDTTVNLPVGNGVLFFFRGNKTNNTSTSGTKTSLPYNYPEDVTFSNSGTLNTGTINVQLWYRQDNYLGYTNSPSLANSAVRGYCLVGNPYASTINWEKYNRNSTVANSSIYGSGSLASTIYMFNPTNKQYEAYMQKTGAIVSADTTTNLDPGTAVGSASNMIASGQGFFVRATSSTQALSFRETAKTTAQPSSAKLTNLMGKPKATPSTDEPLVRIQLSKDPINTDEIVVRLNDNAHDGFVNNEDAQDMGGINPAVSLSAMLGDSLKLCIDRLPFPAKTPQVIPLLVDGTVTGKYNLKLTQLTNLPPIYGVWLKDRLSPDSVNLRTNPVYSFTINKSDSTTFGNRRFQLAIVQEPVPPLQLLSFTANKTLKGSLLQWAIKNEADYTTFYVERSTSNGVTFNPIGSLQSDGSGRYSFEDKSPAIGQNQYRLKLDDINDNISYSNIAALNYAPNENVLAMRINAYPNPAASIINLEIAKDPKPAPYDIRIVSSAGLVVKQAITQQPNWQANINDLQPGTYIVQVLDDTDKTIVGVTSFVKN